MSEKQFVEDHSYLVHYDNCIFDKGQHKHLYLDEVIDLLNELNDENKTLKAQLYCESSVCNICKHQQLTPYKGMRGYYTSKCEKGHKECSKEDLKHCKDFKLEGLSE